MSNSYSYRSLSCNNFSIASIINWFLLLLVDIAKVSSLDFMQSAFFANTVILS